MIDYEVGAEILECARFLLSSIKPSEWNERNRMMTSDVSPIPGMLSYKNSPYTEEIVNCFSPDHPARIIAVMKGAQIGFSTTVIEAAIAWIISQAPGNILYLIGHDDLVDESIAKVDRAIDSSGIRHLIKTNTKRVKNMKTGDTNRKKEFPNGNLIGGIANHKTLRNRSVQYGFIDDFEAMKSKTKEAGSTTDMIEQRFAAYRQKMKLCYISTPELKATSNIEPVYLLGDQRKYFIPCPHCGEFINLEWSIQSKKEGSDKMCGIHWELGEDGKTLIPGSVGYICQLCEEKFDDKNKNALLRAGKWQPTAVPSREGYYSYHISSLYAPTYMYDWEDYVYKFLEANPPGQPTDEAKMHTFKNLVLGETYEPRGTSIKPGALQLNQADYEIGVIPEKLMVKQGNGRCIFLTCAADLGGWIEGRGAHAKFDDARLDYQIIAHFESGSTASIDHGSIGTFTNAWAEKKDEGRLIYTYDISKPNNVWKEFDKVLNREYVSDMGRKIKIHITGIDTGFGDDHVFNYIDKRQGQFLIVGLKGDKEYKYMPIQDNSPIFKPGNRPLLYSLNVNKLKDILAQRITLRWDKYSNEPQPPGFLNFPNPSAGKYKQENFFSHYESEERKMDGNNNFIWQKKGPTVQNHFWDTDIYNTACKEILMRNIFKEYKQDHQIDYKEGTWRDLCKYLLFKWGIKAEFK